MYCERPLLIIDLLRKSIYYSYGKITGKLSFLIDGRSQTTLTRRERYLGGTGNVNNMHIFPSKVKYIIPSEMSNRDTL